LEDKEQIASGGEGSRGAIDAEAALSLHIAYDR